jgi:hypothetical protein
MQIVELKQVDHNSQQIGIAMNSVLPVIVQNRLDREVM